MKNQHNVENPYASVNSSCAQPPTPGYCGAFARLVSPRDGAFAKWKCRFISQKLEMSLHIANSAVATI